MGNPWWRWFVFRTRSTHVSVGFGLLRVAVTAILIASWIVAVAGAPGSASSWAVPAVGGLFLLVRRARIGAAVGVLVAVGDVLLTNDPPLHAPFVLHGVVSLVGFAVLGLTEPARRAPVEPARPHPYFDDGEPVDRFAWRPGPRTWVTVGAVAIVAGALIGGQRDVGAWLVAAGFLGALGLAVVVGRRSRRRAAPPRVVTVTL